MSHDSPLRSIPRGPIPPPPQPIGSPRSELFMEPLSTRLDNYANILLTNHPSVSNPYDVNVQLPKKWEIPRVKLNLEVSGGSLPLAEVTAGISESVAIGQDVYKFENMPKTLVGDLTDAVQIIYDSFQRIERNDLSIAQSLHNITKWSNVYMRILLNLVKVPENCYRLGICKIPTLFAYICLDVFSHKVNNWGQEAQKNSIKLVSDMIEFYDYLYDPLRLWRNHSTNQMLAIDIVVEVPQLVDTFHLIFIDGLRKGWESQTPEFSQLQIPLINIFGSAMFGSVSNAIGVLKPATVMAILSFLSPDPIGGLGGVFIGPILEIIVKIIHLSVSFKDQVGITNNIILRSYLELLNIQELSQFGSEGTELLFCLLARIPDICSTNDKSVIQCELEVAGIFPRLLSILDYDTEMFSGEKIKLFALVIEAMTACLSSCSSSKSAFEAFIGYNRLVKMILNKVPPCEEVLETLLLMVIERSYHEKSLTHCVVQNVPLLLTLLDFTPELTGPLQSWFACRLRDICVQSSLSALKCSLEGITLKLLSMVQAIQEERINLEKESLEAIFKILEFVGRHSITALELKQIIALMRVTLDNKQPPYSARLVKCLEEIASKDGRIKAQSYFDLHDPDSGITLPPIPWPGTAFTFHSWIFIDPTSQTVLSSPTHLIDSISTGLGNLAAFPIRKILYSFLTNQNVGFEAFLTTDCHLVIAVSTKKEYYTYEIHNFAFTDYKWHSLAIVHRKPKQILSDQSECVVYINGILCVKFPFRMPSLKDTFRNCFIGNRPGINPADAHNLIYPRQTKPHKFSEASTVCPVNHQHEIWGYPGSLGGLLGSVVVFSEALTQQQIKNIHSKGTNDLSTFHSCSLTTELGSRLVVFYHPVACIEEKCQDLAPNHIYPDQKLTGKFLGQCYTTHDIRYIINHVGGVELLFPLLENVLLPQSIITDKQQQQQQQQQLQNSTDLDSEDITSTGEFPLAYRNKLCLPGSFFSNSVDNLVTNSRQSYSQSDQKSTSLDFLQSPLSPPPLKETLLKKKLMKTNSNPPLCKTDKVISSPNLRPAPERHQSDTSFNDHNNRDFRTKNSMPMQVRREYSITQDSDEIIELNPKLKLIQQFPEVLHANGEVESMRLPAIKIQTLNRKNISKSPSLTSMKFSN